MCDGYFGFGKRRLKNQNAVTPRGMMRVVHESSSNDHVIFYINVRWGTWKKMMEKFYTVPNTFRSTQNRIF